MKRHQIVVTNHFFFIFLTSCSYYVVNGMLHLNYIYFIALGMSTLGIACMYEATFGSKETFGFEILVLSAGE